jgi:hypothetical protein
MQHRKDKRWAGKSIRETARKLKGGQSKRKEREAVHKTSQREWAKQQPSPHQERGQDVCGKRDRKRGTTQRARQTTERRAKYARRCQERGKHMAHGR